MIRLPKPVTGHDLKRETVAQTLAWIFFSVEKNYELGYLDIDDEAIELCDVAADAVIKVLSEFDD
jgi:hypothetical protein